MCESAAETRALEDLDSLWGDEYDLWVERGKYRARRVDASGHGLVGDTPEQLDAAIKADQAAR